MMSVPSLSPFSEQRAALVVAVLASFLTPFMGSAINVALPAIAGEFHLGAVALSWVTQVFFLTAAVFLLPFGKLADRYGRKRIFLYGIAIYTGTSLLLAMAFSEASLLVLRALQGAGSAMIFGTGMAIVTSVTPPAERGRALGLNVAAVYLGLSLGPFLGGFLTHHLGWRSIFGFNTVVGLFIYSVAALKLRGEWKEPRSGPFDLAGSLLYALAMAALMLGVSWLPSAVAMAAILAGLVLLGLFIRWEAKAESPLIDLRQFLDNRIYAMSNLAALINYSATAAVTFLLSLYLQKVQRLSAQSAGLILVIQPAVMALLSPMAGAISDRLEPRRLASLGMGFTALGLALLALNGSSSLWLVSFYLVLLGIGFGLFSSPNTNAVMSSVEPRYYGVASATLGTMRLTGQMLSMGIVILILALQMKDAKLAERNIPEFVASMRLAFLVFALLCTGGIFASLARGKLRN